MAEPADENKREAARLVALVEHDYVEFYQALGKAKLDVLQETLNLLEGGSLQEVLKKASAKFDERNFIAATNVRVQIIDRLLAERTRLRYALGKVAAKSSELHVSSIAVQALRGET